MGENGSNAIPSGKKLNKTQIWAIIGIIIVASSSTLVLILLNQGTKPTTNPPTEIKPVIWGSPSYTDVYANTSTDVVINVSCDAGISTVILSYSNDSQTNWYNITMTNTISNQYNATLPPQNIETTIEYKFYAQLSNGTWVENNNNGSLYSLYTGDRKAFIVCSANDFYDSESESDFNNGYQSNMSLDIGYWTLNLTSGTDLSFQPEGRSGPTDGSLVFEATVGGELIGEATYDWNLHHSLIDNAYYTISGWIKIEGSFLFGTGARLGLRWKNSSNYVIREEFSVPLLITSDWTHVNISGININNGGLNFSKLELVLFAGGTMSPSSIVRFDDIKMDRWIVVNSTDPTNSSNPNLKQDSDGFPAAALKVYKTLKANGYSDDNIFLMLYHTNDNVIDIKAGDGINNDLLGAVIDVENNDVNASRVKRELNASIAGSFASQLNKNDQLIIYLADHGSNKVLLDGNVTFHFESDNSFITEFEFFNLVSNLTYWRLMINLDFCFSGNFANKNSSIGASWYDLDNCIFVTASANCFSWYWINNQNNDGWAGSWFFYNFWDQLNNGLTITNAFMFALNWIPAGRANPLAVIQAPLLQDNLGLASELSFSSFSKL
ncbi:MAG: C13 family peptidase [Promethearchaeota archaeon]